MAETTLPLSIHLCPPAEFESERWKQLSLCTLICWGIIRSRASSLSSVPVPFRINPLVSATGGPNALDYVRKHGPESVPVIIPRWKSTFPVLQ